jgi:hypothetical protein
MTHNRMTEANEESKRRHLRRLKAAFRSELVGSAEPTQCDLGLIQSASMATVMLRDLEERFAAGERVNPTDFVRVTNVHARALTELRRAKAKAPPRPMTFAERMKAREEKYSQEENDDAEI